MALITSKLVMEGKISPPEFLKRAGATLALLVAIKFAAAHLPMPQDAGAMYLTFSQYLHGVKVLDTFEGHFLDGIAFYSGSHIECLPNPQKKMTQPNIAPSPWNGGLKEISNWPEIFILDLKKKDQLSYLKDMGLYLKPISRHGKYGLFQIYKNERELY